MPMSHSKQSIKIFSGELVEYKKHFKLGFFCIWFNVPLNIFQVISGRCLLVIEDMLTSAVSLKYHTAGTVVWYPARSHYSGNGSNSFFVELPFICRVFDKGASTTNLKSLVCKAGNRTRASKTRSEWSTTLPRW